MSNAVFPSFPGLGWSTFKTPQWSTNKQQAVSGSEVRIANYTYPLYQFDLSYNVLRSDALAELQALVGFFNARQGAFDSFLYTDPEDKSVTAQSFGTGNGTTVGFQLIRTLGGAAEPVMNLNGAPQIYKAGVLQTAGTHYTIDSYGYVTFTSAPTAGQALTWTGSYYYRCRFLEDTLEFDNFAYKLWAAKTVQFLGCLGAKI